MLHAKRSPSNPSDWVPSDRIRRRRVTTACAICRNKRIKCDRSKPVCGQCSLAGRECKYMDDDVLQIEFVTEDLSRTKSEPVTDTVESDTWKSVIKAQADLVEHSSDQKGQTSSWVVAEAQEPSQARSNQNGSSSRPYGIPVNALGDEFLHMLMNGLPSKELCYLYFENFVHCVHPVVPLCYIPTLTQEFANFWILLSSSTSVELLVLILAVLYTGAINTIPPSVDELSIFLRLYEKISERIDVSSYYIRDDVASIQLLQGILIMNTYRASRLFPFSAFGFLPQTIRFAQLLRLHVEKQIANPIEQEVRRRLWWHLVFLDMESIIANGLPPILRSDRYTTAFPSLLHDRVIMKQHGSDYVSSPDDLSTMMIAMRGHYELAHHMQCWFEKTPSQRDVQKFRTTITDLVILLPSIESAEITWARTYLNMQLDRANCMLGLRFWQLDKYERTGCQSEVVKTAQSFLTHYLHLSKLPSPTLNFEWYTSGMLQPLHGSIILLMHLSTCPSLSNSASISNDCTSSRYLLDSILTLRIRHYQACKMVHMRALMDPAFEWPHGTNSRYSILVELRRRVWKKIGWDRDGKSIDPFGGRMNNGGVAAESGEGQQKGTNILSEHLESQTTADTPGFLMNESGSAFDHSLHSNSMSGELEEDPLDLLQWDEWESLTEGLFAS